MQTLTYTKPHVLGTLHDELLALVPGLAPVPGPDGMLVAVLALWDDGGDVITMTVPDDADEPAIAAVVAAHPADPPIISTAQRAATFASDEDAERLRIVAARARVDPSFAALADLALRKEKP